MNHLDESEFDELPEALRLELLAWARKTEAEATGRDIELSATELAEAAAIPLGTVHHRYRVALMKLRHAGISLETFQPFEASAKKGQS
jgi:DNA-directed RNA polymerase specialized sigma24 family protein